MRVLRWLLLLTLCLGLLSMCAGQAAAAEPKPATECGTAIKWDANTTYAPDHAAAEHAIRWAYMQVEPVTGAAAVRSDEYRVEWLWQAELSAGGYDPGTTWWDHKYVSRREYFVHAMDGDKDPSPAALRQQVLRGVVSDFGVENPTSTGAGLSEADQAALTRICTSKPNADGGAAKTKAAMGKDAKQGQRERNAKQKAEPVKGSDAEDAARKAPAWAQNLGGLVVLVFVIGTVLYIAAPMLGERVTVPLRHLKDGTMTRRKDDPESRGDHEDAEQ